MEYITLKQFQEQSKEIQNVILDWWKPEVGDLILWEYFNEHKHMRIIEPHVNLEVFAKHLCIPLLTETQLRRFIEHKICDGKISTEYYEDGYKIFILDSNFDEKIWNDFDTNQNDLLQAYWYTVCTIARSEANL